MNNKDLLKFGKCLLIGILVDLPSANSIKCCSPPASLKANKMNFMEQANRNF